MSLDCCCYDCLRVLKEIRAFLLTIKSDSTASVFRYLAMRIELLNHKMPRLIFTPMHSRETELPSDTATATDSTPSSGESNTFSILTLFFTSSAKKQERKINPISNSSKLEVRYRGGSRI